MIKAVLVLGALALGYLGVNGLLTANPSSQTDFIVAGVELIGAIVLIGLAFVTGKDPEATAPAASPEADDRAEVIERLQRHTEALRRAEEDAHVHPIEAAPEAPEPKQAVPPADEGKDEEKEEKPATAVEQPAVPEEAFAPPARLTVRLPALMLLNVGATATAADIESAPPLGPREEVLARLKEIVPDLETDEQGRARHTGPDHTIDLDLGAGPDIHTVVVDAAGGTGISLVRWFLESTGWRAFAPKLGRFVEPDALESVAVTEE